MVADDGVKDNTVADSPVSVLENEVSLFRATISRIYLFIFVMFVCVLLLITVFPTGFHLRFQVF